MATVNYVPSGYHTLTPSLTCKGAAKAIEFYKQVFGANEISRMETPGGGIGHAELQIGDSRLMLNDEFPGMAEAPAGSGPRAVYLMLYTQDVDTMYERAVKAGCSVQYPLADQFWGDRFGRVMDPFGHSWGLAQHIEDVTKEEMTRRVQAWQAQMAKSAGND
jgi:PhnB protein